MPQAQTKVITSHQLYPSFSLLNITTPASPVPHFSWAETTIWCISNYYIFSPLVVLTSMINVLPGAWCFSAKFFLVVADCLYDGRAAMERLNMQRRKYASPHGISKGESLTFSQLFQGFSCCSLRNGFRPACATNSVCKLPAAYIAACCLLPALPPILPSSPYT